MACGMNDVAGMAAGGWLLSLGGRGDEDWASDGDSDAAGAKASPGAVGAETAVARCIEIGSGIAGGLGAAVLLAL